MTVSDSSSSATDRLEAPAVGLAAAGLLGALPSAFVAGRDRDLLDPLRFAHGAAAPEGLAAPPPAVERAELARALATANAGYGHPSAEALARRLADPATRVVVTGQQPGLFGGPLYTLSKAVAATLWAEQLRAAGHPAVAVFWVATEDHDFREVARATFLTANGPRNFDLGEDSAPLMPVGMRTFGSPVGEVLRQVGEALPGDRFADWTATLARWYRPDARFGEAFCRLLAHLLGERCPLLLDAMLPAVKQAERPWLRLLVERRAEIEAVTAEREAGVQARGYDLQVKPQPGSSSLFLLHGRERRRIAWQGARRYELRGADGTSGEVGALLDTLEENPAVVSPGVLARPAVQDAILGTTLQVLGPGELSYLVQVAPAYGVLGIAPPAVALRPHALVLERHQLAKLDGSGVGLADLVAPDFDLERLLTGGRERQLLAGGRSRLETGLAELERAALDVDDGLAGPWQKTREQIGKALDVFEGKVGAALARHHEVARQRAASLRAACRPLGTPQERIVSTAHYPGKYGPRFVDAWFEQLSVDATNLQVITP